MFRLIRTRIRSRLVAQVAVPGLIVVIFLATTRWTGWTRGIEITGAGDDQSYLAIARAAPALPTEKIGSAYTDRFLIHYFIGLVGRSGLGIILVYRAAVILTAVLIILLVCRVLAGLAIAGSAAGLSVALVVLNPYAIRIYVMDPPGVADLAFTAALSAAVYCLARVRPLLLTVAVAVGVTFRQTMLLPALVFAVAVLLLDDWRGRRRAVRACTALTLVLGPLATLAAVRWLVRPFSVPFEPRIPADTILSLTTDRRIGAAELVGHVARVAVPLLTPMAVLTAALLACRRQERRPRSLAWVLLGIAAAIVMQPLAVSDSFPGFRYNEPRLSALALVPIVLAAAITAPEAALARISPLRGCLVVVWLGLGSTHHLMTVVGPASADQFLVIQVVVACGLGVAVAVFLARSSTGSRSAPTTVTGSPPTTSALVVHHREETADAGSPGSARGNVSAVNRPPPNDG